jgi:hypothetical protein
VVIVGIDAASVEADLVGGLLACPVCGARLRPWGHALEREIRLGASSERRRFRRSRCAECGITHVLVPEDTLVRRRDAVEVIGAALVAKAQGAGHRSIAKLLGRAALDGLDRPRPAKVSPDATALDKANGRIERLEG